MSSSSSLLCVVICDSSCLCGSDDVEEIPFPPPSIKITREPKPEEGQHKQVDRGLFSDYKIRKGKPFVSTFAHPDVEAWQKLHAKKGKKKKPLVDNSFGKGGVLFSMKVWNNISDIIITLSLTLSLSLWIEERYS